MDSVSASKGARSPELAARQGVVVPVGQLNEGRGPGWYRDRQQEPVTIPGPPDEYLPVRSRDRALGPPQAAGMRRHREGLVAGLDRLYAEHVAGQDRGGSGRPAVRQAGPGLGGRAVRADVLPHGPGEERVTRVDHLVPGEVHQVLGVGGVARQVVGLDLVRGDVRADQVAIGGSGERLRAVPSPQGLQRAEDAGHLGRRRDAEQDGQGVGVLGEGGVVGVAQVVGTGRRVEQAGVHRVPDMGGGLVVRGGLGGVPEAGFDIGDVTEGLVI